MNKLYYFTSVSGVLPDPTAPAAESLALSLSGRRSYVPRGSRPHIAWVADAGDNGDEACALGSYSRLKGDGTCSRDADDEDPAAPSPPQQQQQQSSPPHGCRLTQLVTVDGATGCRALRIAPGGVARGSAPIPSGRRIASMILDHRSSSGNSTNTTAAAFSSIVSDDKGNVYRLVWGDASFSSSASAAAAATVVESSADGGRKRDRNGGAVVAAGATTPGALLLSWAAEATWETLVDAHSHIPVGVYGRPDGAPYSTLSSRLAVSRGAPGYVGLGFVTTTTTSGGRPLVCVREGYNDVRVIDTAVNSVVQTYGTTHRPTALYIPSAWDYAADDDGGAGASARFGPLASTALVCEGTLATLFDVRCPGAVMTVAEMFEAAPDPATSTPAVAEAGGLEEATTEAKRGSNTNNRTTKTAPLVPGRLTSTLGLVTDACATANPYEVALSIDRALCVYDLRKFTRLFSSSNVLKYNIASIASTAQGRAVVCAGIDSEVRIIPLYTKPSSEEEGAVVLSLAGTNNPAGAVRNHQQAEQRAAAAAAAERGEDPDTADVAAVSTFRTRLNTSVSCASTWQGGWVTAVNHRGAAAVGISLDHEVFIAQ